MSLQLSKFALGNLEAWVGTMMVARNPVAIKIKRWNNTHVAQRTTELRRSPNILQTSLNILRHNLYRDMYPAHVALKRKALENSLGGVASSCCCENTVDDDNIPTTDPISTLPATNVDMLTPASSTALARGFNTKMFESESAFPSAQPSK